MSEPVLSVIVPIYNEEEVLPHLYTQTKTVLERLAVPYEIIFIDDGSKDASLSLLKKFSQENQAVKIISFSRNFGHQTALTAGLQFTSGKAVAILDGDLQDPPEVIEKFFEQWKNGYEVVYGIRLNRKENPLKRILYKLYYRLLRILSKTVIPLDSGDCCLMDRTIVALLNKMPERNRFIRGLRSWVGFRQIGIPYDRDRRFAGKPKYTLLKLVRLGLDGIISFSEIPLKGSIIIGFSISTLSVFYSLYIILNRLFHATDRLPGWSTIVVAITFLGGIQLMVMGFLGEYVLRIYDEIKGRPQYIIDSLIGFNAHAHAEDISNHSRP